MAAMATRLATGRIIRALTRGFLPLGAGRRALHEAPAEAPLDAEIAARNVVVEGRRGLDDLAVLHVERQGAADAAVRTNGVRRRLRGWLPAATGSKVVLAARHQRAGRADGDAVAAVHARRGRQRGGELRRDAGVESTPGHRD